jgi:hypothetical protein
MTGFDFGDRGRTWAVGFLVSLIVTAFGFVLALAVHPTNPGSVDVNTVGWILVVFGLIGFFADLLLWSSWGPGYMRRTYVDEQPGGYGAYPAQRGFGRRRVIEEEEGGAPGPRY